MKTLLKNLTDSAVIVAGVAASLLYGESFAATQRTLSPNSTGSVTISATKAARARVSGLTDLTLTSWVENDGNVTLTTDACVYSSRALGAYTVKATGSGIASAFTIANGPNTLPYNVTWNSGGVGALTNTGAALTSGVTSPGLTRAARDSATCTGATPGPNARLIVGLLAANLANAADGAYTGTITLLVTPN